MQVTSENVIWIVIAIIAAAIVAFFFIRYAMTSIQRADFVVFDVQAFSDGTVLFTVKNTGTVPITQVTIDGVAASATGITNLEGGQEAQYQATGLSLTAGECHTFTIVATFANGQTKTLRVKAIVQS